MDPERLEELRRNSGLALTKDGVWTWGGVEVANARVQEMFHRGVAIRDDGELTLSVGRMWAYFTSAGPVFFVRAVRGLGTAAPRARLLGDRELPLASRGSAAAAEGDRTVAGWGPDERLYLWLAGLGGPAICLWEAHQALLAHLDERDGQLVLACGPADAASSKASTAAVSGHTADDLDIAVTPLDTIPAPNAPRPS